MTNFKQCHSSTVAIGTYKITKGQPELEFYGGSLNEAEDWAYAGEHLNIRLDARGTLYKPCQVFKTEPDILLKFPNTQANSLLMPAPSLLFDWEDHGVIHFTRVMWREFIEELLAYVAEEGINTIYTHCVGGHGRTGTFYAILLGWLKVFLKDPVLELRKIYCEESVESIEQLQYIEYILERKVTQTLPIKTYVQTPPINGKNTSKYWVSGKGWYSTASGQFLSTEYNEAEKMLKIPPPAALTKFESLSIVAQNKYLDKLADKVVKYGTPGLTDEEYQVWSTELGHTL